MQRTPLCIALWMTLQPVQGLAQLQFELQAGPSLPVLNYSAHTTDCSRLNQFFQSCSQPGYAEPGLSVAASVVLRRPSGSALLLTVGASRHPAERLTFQRANRGRHLTVPVLAGIRLPAVGLYLDTQMGLAAHQVRYTNDLGEIYEFSWSRALAVSGGVGLDLDDKLSVTLRVMGTGLLSLDLPRSPIAAREHPVQQADFLLVYRIGS